MLVGYGSRGDIRLRPPGNLCQEVESEGSRSLRWRPQAGKCLEQRVIARRSARDEAWSEPGNSHGRGFSGVLRESLRARNKMSVVARLKRERSRLGCRVKRRLRLALCGTLKNLFARRRSRRRSQSAAAEGHFVTRS